MVFYCKKYINGDKNLEILKISGMNLVCNKWHEKSSLITGLLYDEVGIACKSLLTV